ncbi:MAG: hypothetical protein H6884_07730 [Rhodobiaceae bacterium]|nr:hypothetical protein [Rhodobiaceae bacterium]MCC0053933.1 hypothetical protein [Rhodobiaceae bacterium]
MKLLRTIRFDASDDHVYEAAAASGEWAVPGGFAFAHLDRAALAGKTRQAFANGFLSLDGFGRSTFASVAEISGDEHERLVERLAAHFCEAYGAPDMEAARPVARAELDFVAGLVADVPVNTLFTLRRFHDDAGEIREEFRTVTPPQGPLHARIWDVADDDER